MLLIVGSLTPGRSPSPAKGEGLSTFRFNPATGDLDLLHVRGGIDSPSFVAVHPTRPLLYAVSEVADWNEGTLAAYRIDRDTGRLAYVNKQPTLGNCPCFCEVDPTGRCVGVANYSAGDVADEPRRTFAILPVREDGGLASASHAVQLHGTGPDPERQEQPHGHWIGFSPDGRFALAVDLGTDRLLSYPLDILTGTLDEARALTCTLPPGAGPRHLAFHPNGRTAYLSLEMGNGVARLDYDPATGAVTLRDLASTLPETWTDTSSVSDLQLTADGRFLYAANRGHDGVAIFRCGQDGALVPLGHTAGHGERPRHLALDPSGRWLFASFQDSHALGQYAVDPETGTLDLHRTVAVGSPMCVAFA